MYLAITEVNVFITSQTSHQNEIDAKKSQLKTGAFHKILILPVLFLQTVYN